VKAVNGDTYEVRWDPAGDAWSVHRAWLQNMV